MRPKIDERQGVVDYESVLRSSASLLPNAPPILLMPDVVNPIGRSSSSSGLARRRREHRDGCGNAPVGVRGIWSYAP
jgi:hypothetical protein